MLPPSSDIDIFDDAHLIDPYPNLDALRAQAAIVKLDRYDVFAITRFDELRAVLRDWETFVSGQGVFMNAILNEVTAGQMMLVTDGEAHSRLRRVVGAPLTPKALEDVKAHLAEEARTVVARHTGQQIDGVKELAHHLPVTIVGSLLGVPDEGRENLLTWANALADAAGPVSDRVLAAMAVTGEMFAFMQTCTAERVKPGGWAAGIWAAVERGEIEAPEAFSLMGDYIGPALETTIIGTANMIELFAKHPDQYALLREHPELLTNAVHEVLRYQSVFHNFTRVASRDTEVGGFEIAAGSRVVLLYGAANRDERHFEDPTRFDITRANAGEHVSLGHGRHACAGGNLARMEMGMILQALLDHVKEIEFIGSQRSVNNSLHTLERLDIRLVAASPSAS